VTVVAFAAVGFKARIGAVITTNKANQCEEIFIAFGYPVILTARNSAKVT
jgi:hypothetical protein